VTVPAHLTVAFLGNHQFGVPKPENRHSTETQLAATLEAMGHTVLRLQEDSIDWATVTHAARHADLFLWVTTWWLDPDGARRCLKELALAQVPTVSFHLDLYYGLNRAHRVVESPFFETDYVFTADGGHQAEFEAAGVNHIWLPPAVYAPNASLGQVQDEHAWPIIFIGSYPYPHIEHSSARRDVIQTVQSRFGRRFRVYTGGYRGQALADLIASATVVVGDSCLAGSSPRYWSDRVPETLGRGGFLIHPYVEGIEASYTDGVHLRLYQPGDQHQLVTLIEHYLADPAAAQHIGLAGHAHVRAHHTYTNRMATVLGEVFG
jgi:hypothetical protein